MQGHDKVRRVQARGRGIKMERNEVKPVTNFILFYLKTILEGQKSLNILFSFSSAFFVFTGIILRD